MFDIKMKSCPLRKCTQWATSIVSGECRQDFRAQSNSEDWLCQSLLARSAQAAEECHPAEHTDNTEFHIPEEQGVGGMGGAVGAVLRYEPPNETEGRAPKGRDWDNASC